MKAELFVVDAVGNVALNFQHFLLLYSDQAAASNKEAGLQLLFLRLVHIFRLWETLENHVVFVFAWVSVEVACC